MKTVRMILLVVIIVSGLFLVVILGINKTETPLHSTFAPAFQFLGIAPKSVDRAFSRALPVDALDEKEFGESIAAGYDSITDPTDPLYVRMNVLLAGMQKYAKKPFAYRVYIIDAPYPNAFALPGGVIILTSELCRIIPSDGEFTAILAHEMGHIELAHCFDAVRFELLFGESGDLKLSEMFDFAVNFLFRHSFGKYEENEADEYAFELLLLSDYDPLTLSGAFTLLLAHSGKSPENAALIRDYFLSHPPMEIRIEKYKERATKWWKSHPGADRKR